MADNNEDAAPEDESCLHISLSEDRVIVHGENHRSLTFLAEVSSATIVVLESFVELTEAGLQLLEGGLRATTNLRSINVERLVHATTSIPVRALSRILRLETLRQLTDLRVLGTRLEGSRDEWLELATLLEPDNLPCLEFICMVEPLAWLPHIPAGALDPLLRVCAHHSALKFMATNLFSSVSFGAIDEICQSTQIMGLHLVDTDVSPERVFRFLKGMQTNRKIWFLSVAFAEHISAEHGTAIADLLRHNATLANLSIKSKKPLREDFLLELTKGLKDATVLDFSVEGKGDGPVIGEGTRRSISEMLEQNKSIHSLQLEGVINDNLEKEINTMTRLNRAGRKSLDSNATTRQWIEVLSTDDLRDNLDCIYYLLSKNPELMCGMVTPTKPPFSNVIETTDRNRKRKHEEIASVGEKF